MFLTLESIEEHPDFKAGWSHCQGRWQLFHVIQNFLTTSGIDTTPVSPPIEKDRVEPSPARRTNTSSLAEAAMKWLWTSALTSQTKTLENIHLQHQSAADNHRILSIEANNRLRIHSLQRSLDILTAQPSSSSSTIFEPPVRVRGNTIKTSATAIAIAIAATHTTNAGDNSAVQSNQLESNFDETAKWPSSAKPSTVSDHPNPPKATTANDHTNRIDPTINSNVSASLAPSKEKERAKPVSWTVDLNDNNTDTNINNSPNQQSHAHSEDSNAMVTKQPPPHIRRRMQELGASKDETFPSAAFSPSAAPETMRAEVIDRTTLTSSSSSRSHSKRGSAGGSAPSVLHRPDSASLLVDRPEESRKEPPQVASRPAADSKTPRREASSIAPPATVSFGPAYLLFQADCPVRCAVQMTTAGDVRDSVKVAIGSNAKSIHLLSYSTPSQGRGSSSNSNVAIDYTASVRIEKTIENSHKGSIYALDFHPNLAALASGSNDKLVKLWR